MTGVGERDSYRFGDGPPRVFVSYSHDSKQHKELVREFATFLRAEIGADVHLDRWYDAEKRDWSLWAIEQLSRADFVLAIASPDYKRRAEGFERPDRGRGAQFESAMLRDAITRNIVGETRRILPVVLPGRSIDEIPVFLLPHSTTHFVIDEFTPAGVANLIAAFTGRGEHPMPARGQWIGSPHTGPAPTSVSTPTAPISVPVRRKARLLTTVLEPVRRGPDLRFDSADLDAEHYGNSIIHRCPVFCGDPRSPIEYNLGRRYREFEAVVGILDDAVDVNQTGHFQVFLDNEPRQQVRATYGEPIRIHYDVSRVLRLRLVAYRPDTIGRPMLAGVAAAVGKPRRLPELAWGDPTLFE